MIEIPVSGGKVALIDDEDYQYVICYKWSQAVRKNTVYAIYGSHGLLMHRFIMNPPPELVVHHKDRNGLNNQRNNLEVITHQQNMAHMVRTKPGSSKYRGVTHINGTYIVRFMMDRQVYHIGSFRSEDEAAIAYNRAILQVKGPGYPLNEVPL